MAATGRGVTRARRTNMHFSSGGGISSLSPSSRDAVVDPIAELLSQLSGVRRGAQPTTPSQLQQLQMQLQLERQQATAARQQLERLPRRGGAAAGGSAAPAPQPQPAQAHPHPQPDANDSHFLLSGFLGTSNGQAGEEAESRAALLRGLMLASLRRAPPPPPLPPLPAPPPPPATTVEPAPVPEPAPVAVTVPVAVPARVKPQPRTKVPFRARPALGPSASAPAGPEPRRPPV